MQMLIISKIIFCTSKRLYQAALYLTLKTSHPTQDVVLQIKSLISATYGEKVSSVGRCKLKLSHNPTLKVNTILIPVSVDMSHPYHTKVDDENFHWDGCRMVSHCRTSQSRIVLLYKMPKCWIVRCSQPDSRKNLHNQLALCSVGFDTVLKEIKSGAISIYLISRIEREEQHLFSKDMQNNSFSGNKNISVGCN